MIKPHFLVIGAYKSGTTALHHYLRVHPEIFIPERKEPNYYAFADQTRPFNHPAASGSIRTQAEYESLFAQARQGQVLGEVSPAYMAASGACARIYEDAPDVRLIAILRNPIERAYSDFLMYKRDGLEHEEQFIDALKDQDRRDSSLDPTSHYISTGFYFEQLRPYFETFDREKIHILLHEEFVSERDHALMEIFRFLGIDHSVEIPDQSASNVSGVPTTLSLRAAYAVRNQVRDRLRKFVPEDLKRKMNSSLERRLTKEPLSPDARSWLTDIYRSDIENLGALVNLDLSSWLRT